MYKTQASAELFASAMSLYGKLNHLLALASYLVYRHESWFLINLELKFFLKHTLGELDLHRSNVVVQSFCVLLPNSWTQAIWILFLANLVSGDLPDIVVTFDYFSVFDIIKV